MTAAADGAIFFFDDKNPILTKFYWRTTVGAGIERKIGSQVSLFFRYQLDKQWQNASRETGMTMKPSWYLISLGTAVRW
jgi:hypothetical protein